MSKLLPWLLIFAALLYVMGSIDVPVPYLPQPSGDGYIAMQGVCSAPPSLLPALCDQYPVLRRATEFIQRSEKLVEARMPVIMSLFPAGRGSLIDSIFVKTAPRFL
jgi:hypothetical protein